MNTTKLKLPTIAQRPAALLLTLTCTWPLVSLELAMLALGLDRAKTLALIENGKLRYAWNIAPRVSTRPLIRIYRQSVIEYKNDLCDLAGSHAAVMDAIFPTIQGNPTGMQLCHAFQCGPDHPLRLGRLGLIKPVRPARRGRCGSPPYSRSSLIAFLKARQLP